VDDHGQAGLLRCRPTADYADGQAPVAQGIQESRVELASTPTSTRAGDAGHSIGGRLTEVYCGVLRRPEPLCTTPSRRAALAIHPHRLNAMAEWKVVMGIAA